MLNGTNDIVMRRQREFVRVFVRPNGLSVSATGVMADALETLGAAGPVDEPRDARFVGKVGFAALRVMNRLPAGRRLLLDEREVNSKKRRADEEQASGAAGIA